MVFTFNCFSSSHIALFNMATGFSIASSSTENNLSSSCSASLLYKLKITLFDDHCTDEEVRWRRVIVPANFSLYGLHIIIQEIFGWKNYRMHNFMSMGEECSLSEDEESSLIEQPSKKPKNDRPEHDPVEYKVTDGYWEIEKLTEVGKCNGLFARHSHVLVHIFPAIRENKLSQIKVTAKIFHQKI